MNTVSNEVTGFKEYESKPITRRAYEIKVGDVIERLGEVVYGILIRGKAYEFKAYEEIMPGDFVVYLNDSDIYHCSAAVFHERNIV